MHSYGVLQGWDRGCNGRFRIGSLQARRSCSGSANAAGGVYILLLRNDEIAPEAEFTNFSYQTIVHYLCHPLFLIMTQKESNLGIMSIHATSSNRAFFTFPANVQGRSMTCTILADGDHHQSL